jgi:phytoene dehydrogenase-like protein
LERNRHERIPKSCVTESERYGAVVIGAGVAGLTAAAELSFRNTRVLVIERHYVPGGCPSFYQRDGYRFDVGATRFRVSQRAAFTAFSTLVIASLFRRTPSNLQSPRFTT